MTTTSNRPSPRARLLLSFFSALALIVAGGLLGRGAHAATLTPLNVVGIGMPNQDNCTVANGCTAGYIPVNVSGTAIERLLVQDGVAKDVFVSASFQQTGAAQFISGYYKITCDTCTPTESPESIVNYGWTSNVPAAGGLSFLFRTSASQNATFRLQVRSANGNPFTVGNVNFMALPLRTSDGGSLTRTRTGDRNIDYFYGTTVAGESAGTKYTGVLSGTKNSTTATLTNVSPAPNPAWLPGTRIWIMGADANPTSSSDNKADTFNGEFVLVTANSGTNTYTFTMQSGSQENWNPVPSDPLGGIQIRLAPTPMRDLVTMSAPDYGFLRNPEANVVSGRVVNSPLEAVVTTPSTVAGDIVYAFSASVGQNNPGTGQPWRVGEFQVFYREQVAGSTPVEGASVWQAVPSQSFVYTKSADASFVGGPPDIGDVAIFGRLQQTRPNRTYTFRVVAGYQTYQTNTEGVLVLGASLAAFNTSYQLPGGISGYFRTVYGSGRLYNNAANNLSWLDVCQAVGGNCSKVGEPPLLRTESFGPAQTSTNWAGFGSTYGWVTKSGGAAGMNNYGLAANVFGTLPTSNFNGLWSSTATVSRQYQGSRPKNCQINGIGGRGCDVSATMTNGLVPSTGTNALVGAGPFWAGATGSLTGQQAGISGDVLFFELSSSTPTWASPVDVRGGVVEGRPTLYWTTSSEYGTASFRLERFDPATAEYTKVGPEVLPALPPWPAGASYEVVDEAARPGSTFEYRIIETETNGNEISHGPYTVTFEPGASSASSVSKSGLRGLSVGSGTYKRTITPPSEGPVLRPPLAERDLPWARSSWKIPVTEEGIYSIDLSSADGPEMSRNHALSNLGRPVAVANDGANKRLLFFGTPLRNRHTERNAFLLQPGGPVYMKQQNGKAPAPAAQPASFPSTIRLEADVWPSPGWVFEEDQDFWFWQVFMAENAGYRSAELPFTVQKLESAGGAARISVDLYSISDVADVADVQVDVSVNGAPAGKIVVDGRGKHVADVTFDAALLREGANKLRLDARLAPGLSKSWWYLNSFQATYPRRFEAVSDEVRVRVPQGLKSVSVSGFAKADVVVFDVTNPLEPIWVNAVSVKSAGGSHTVTFPVNNGATDYFVSASVRKAERAPLVDAGLKARGVGARHVVIAPYDLLVAAGELSKYRSSQGLSSLAVPLEAIWDEFGYGVPSPGAVRDFLAHAAANWSPAPRYVALAGKGTYDEKNIYGLNDCLIPTNFKTTIYGLTGTDAPFVAGLSMAIGRIPAVTGADLLQFTTKVAAHERSGANGRVTLLADNPDSAGDFVRGIEDLATAVPLSYDVNLSDLRTKGLAAIRKDARDAFQRGDEFVGWVGHGGHDRLAAEGVLTTSDVPALQAGPRLSLFAGATCNVNGFYFPGFMSLGERLVNRPGGGAAASWAPTGASLNDNSVATVLSLLDSLYTRDGYGVRLGDVILEVQGSEAAGVQEEVLIWQLLGDPGTLVK